MAAHSIIPTLEKQINEDCSEFKASQDYKKTLKNKTTWFILYPLHPYFVICVGVCLHVCLCTLCMQYPWRPEEGAGSVLTQGRGGSLGLELQRIELPHGCWESKPGLLEEEPVLLTVE